MNISTSERLRTSDQFNCSVKLGTIQSHYAHITVSYINTILCMKHFRINICVVRHTPFCLHNSTMKSQSRLADSLSIKFSFLKHCVALFCAKLITSTLWVSSLGEKKRKKNYMFLVRQTNIQITTVISMRNKCKAHILFKQVKSHKYLKSV